MTSEKYIGLDVHQATISVAVMDASGKLVMESILETKASTLLQFLAGLRGNLSVTFEEGTWAAWLYDVLKPHVTHLVVCNPRKNALLKAGHSVPAQKGKRLARITRETQFIASYPRRSRGSQLFALEMRDGALGSHIDAPSQLGAKSVRLGRVRQSESSAYR